MNFPQTLITSGEGVVVRSLFNSGKGVLIESTIYNLQSINASTILDKIFEIK